MSIDLPRSHRALHFSGSVKALAPERSNALGRERPNRAALNEPPPKSARAADVYVVDASRTPYVGSRPSERAERVAQPATAASENVTIAGHGTHGPRPQLASMDEDILTDALDNDKLDAALFPVAKRANASSPPPNLPVPGFRSAAEAKQHHAVPTVIVGRPQGGKLPLGVWLGIALIAAVVSFNLAPQAAESFSEAVRALDTRDR